MNKENRKQLKVQDVDDASNRLIQQGNHFEVLLPEKRKLVINISHGKINSGKKSGNNINTKSI